jgi:hypothetical protein
MKIKQIENESFWEIRTPKFYPENVGCYEVVWKNIFMPFDVICGLDWCMPDNKNYKKDKKTSWWVVPQTKYDEIVVHDISMFMVLPKVKSFKKLEDAISFCFKWREKWLENELSKTSQKI